MVDLGPVLEPCLNLPPFLPFVLPVIITFPWLNNLDMITQSHCYNWTFVDGESQLSKKEENAYVH